MQTIHLNRESENVYGLGAYTMDPKTVQAINTINNITATADALAPNVAPAYQSDFSKAMGSFAGIAGTVAAVGASIPVPVIQAAAIVIGAIAGVAAVLGKIFGNSKAKQYAAERAQYQAVIDQMLADNLILDQQYETLKAAIDNFKLQLKNEGVGVNGLGLCIINCKKKKEAKKLAATKETYDELVQIQKEKIQMLIFLTDEYNSLLKNLNRVDQSNDIITLLKWGFGIAATTALVMYLKKQL